MLNLGRKYYNGWEAAWGLAKAVVDAGAHTIYSQGDFVGCLATETMNKALKVTEGAERDPGEVGWAASDGGTGVLFRRDVNPIFGNCVDFDPLHLE